MKKRPPVAERMARDTKIAAAKDYWGLVLTLGGFIVSKAVRWHEHAMKRGLSVEMDDLVSEGKLGAYKAATLYKPERGMLFSTYAVWHIDSFMQKWVSDHARDVRVPRIRQSRTAKRNLATFRGAVDEAAQRKGREVSLHVRLHDGATLGEVLAAETESADEVVARQQEAVLLEKALAKLPARARDVLVRRSEDERLEDIAVDYDLSRERVRQIAVQFKDRLRVELAAMGEGRVG